MSTGQGVDHSGEMFSILAVPSISPTALKPHPGAKGPVRKRCGELPPNCEPRPPGSKERGETIRPFKRTHPARPTRLMAATRWAFQPPPLSQFPVNFRTSNRATTGSPVAGASKQEIAPEVPLDLADASINPPLFEPQMPTQQFIMLMDAHLRPR